MVMDITHRYNTEQTMNMIMDTSHRYSTEQAMNMIMDTNHWMHLLLTGSVDMCSLDL